ncbi:hypothetical protein F2Q68_00021072 [Brassica cretica]|uniref:Uncharacterized protein n=1 Tax=Brassica cretica TaxID=69181 RepID=A0A8S9FYA2_BRACR|nr:hypothetical protein F2Q68_00021072 [Brassica cretica]
MQPSFCLIEKLKRSSAENSRRPKTLTVSSLSLPLLRCLSLFSLSPPRRRSLSPRHRTLSLSSPAPCGSGGDRISTFSYPCSRSRSRLRCMPSSTRSNKETQLLFSPVPASLERSIRKEAHSSLIDNTTCSSINFFQPPSTQTLVPSTDTRSPLSTKDTHLLSTDIFHLTSIDTLV